MIEIIRDEEWERTKEPKNTAEQTLPKDIKQIGRPDIGDRIYVENQAYQFLHPYDSTTERDAYVLLGRFENYAGKQCTFVEAAIHLEGMCFEGEIPVWNDGTWAYIYKQMRQEYDNMAIVGWAMDIRGQLPNMTMRIENLHQANFGGAHQVLFLMDSLEREEAFYSSVGGHLRRREGFYIYYERRHAIPAMPVRENPVKKVEPEISEDRLENINIFESEDAVENREMFENTNREYEPRMRTVRPSGIYREQVMRGEEKEKQTFFPAYSSTLVLALIVCALGYGAYKNYQKMNAMQETIAQMNASQAGYELQISSETEESESGLKVENVEGTVEKQENTESGATAQNGTETDETAQETVANEQTVGESTEGASGTEETANTSDTAAQSDGNATTGEGATETTATENAAAQNNETESNTTETLTTGEAQDYLAQGYYIVQKGDSLVGICRKVYQTTAMMDKLCEANGIDDPDAIYAGQYLVLPN